ncbi:diaminopimelate epimerase [Candidatus Bathyarchaeota archaeon]|nr:diaminopimelate epimerase [Candidatus Bathyarchaeota archaeon]
MSFWKMHGLGNDFIVIDNRNGQLPEKDLGKITEKLCKRYFSIGADGSLILCNSEVADVKMRIFNADGTEAETSGNGIRCFAKYCYEKGVAKKKEIKIETLAGVKTVWVETDKGKVSQVMVDMGEPVFDKPRIPVVGDGTCVNEDLNVDDASFKVTCVSVGNPHCIIFVEDVNSFPVGTYGPKIETHKMFPARINVEFVQYLNRKELKMRVWERGVGETMACGTGACASVAAANLLGKVDSPCTVHLLGGDLKIQLKDKNILMTGPAEKAFEGVVEL